MRKYLNKPMGELASELTAGLVRYRKGYVDAAEALLQVIDAAQEYPYEFVVFRLTGYRPQGSNLPGEALQGKPLRGDLLTLILDVSDSFDLRTTDYAEPVYDVPALAKRFGISGKTVQRWRAQGLAGRRLVFPDGKGRIAFLESSVARFVSGRSRQVRRSSQFSHMTDEERADLLRRARRLAAAGGTLSEILRRLSRRTGRAGETIRYTIRRHDAEHPEAAVFPDHTAPLADDDRTLIYQAFLRGTSAPKLARQFRRSRGSVYRIVNEMRALQLLQRKIGYVYNPQFDLPNADELVLSGANPSTDPCDEPHRAHSPEDLPAYLQSLYEVPLLEAETERDLFRRYNYLKYKADRLRKRIDPRQPRMKALELVESLLLEGNLVKNRIIRANLRLVVSIAKKHLGGPMTLFELISDGNMSLMRAVEKFDYARGYRFSTYASWAIMRNFARTVPRERSQQDRFATGHDEVLDVAASLRIYDPDELNLPELRESIDVLLSRLTPLERSVLIEHYGLDDPAGAKTLHQLGERLGLSKERVRQIELRALKKLRIVMKPREAESLM